MFVLEKSFSGTITIKLWLLSFPFFFFFYFLFFIFLFSISISSKIGCLWVHFEPIFSPSGYFFSFFFFHFVGIFFYFLSGTISIIIFIPKYFWFIYVSVFLEPQPEEKSFLIIFFEKKIFFFLNTKR